VALGALGSSAVAASAGTGSADVYVTNSNDTVSSYAIGKGGALAAGATSTGVKGGGVPYAMAVSPNGRYAYIVEDRYAKAAGSVAQYTVAGSGALTADRTPTVAAGVGPIAIAVSPNGRFVYVANEDAGTVSLYTVGAGGALAAVTADTVRAGVAPDAIALSPNGRYLYVANQYAGKASQDLGGVSQFKVGAGGALTAQRTPEVVAGGQPDSIAVSPNGRYLYVANFRGSGGVSQYTVGSSGMLTADHAATVKAGTAPHAIAVSPSGRYVYVATEDGKGGARSATGGVSQYTVGASGTLTPDPTPAVSAGPGAFSLAIAPGGRYVYVVNDSTRGPGAVSQYTVGATGMLKPDAPATVKGGDLPLAIAVAPGA
jgi:6-phosphogluconolactonase (cycloisomerase 2 family)